MNDKDLIQPVSIQDCLRKYKVNLDNSSEETTVCSGFKAFREASILFQKGEIVVLAGRPGMGKRSLLLSLAINMCKQIPIIFFTLDLSPEQLTDHIVSSITEIPYEAIIERELISDEKNRIDSAQRSFLGKFYICGDKGASLDDFVTSCKNIIKEKGCEVILIDTMQLLRSFENGGKRNPEDILDALKALARKQKICIIISYHIARSVDLRAGNKRPMLIDLCEKGVIEQVADKIMFLYRPFYYGLTEDENGENAENIAEVIIEKNDFGRTGTVRLFYDRNISKFKDYYVSGCWEDEGDLKEFS